MSGTDYIDDDQLEEKRKILSLGDQAAFEEQSAITQQKNEELIQHLKQQNAEIRKRLIDLQRENVAEHYNVSEANKGALQNQLIVLKKDLDKQNTDKLELQKRKRKLNEQYRELKGLAPMDANAAPRKKIRNLENQLDKFVIKYNEAQSIRKTYEQIIKRLNEEEANFNAQLAEMEETMAQRNEDLEELLLMQKSARSSRDMAKMEVTQVRQESENDRKRFEKKLRQKERLYQQKVESRERRLEAEEERMRLQEDNDSMLNENQNRSLHNEYQVVTSERNMTDQEIMRAEERLAKDEESLRRMKEATGDDDVNKVIQKFLVQTEYYKECEERRKTTEGRLERAKIGRAAAAQELEQAKEEGADKVSEKVRKEQLERELESIKSKENETRKRYIESKQQQIEVNEGIHLITTKLAITCIPPGMSEDDVDREGYPNLLPTSSLPTFDEHGIKNPDDDSYVSDLFQKMEECVTLMMEETREYREEQERRKQEREDAIIEAEETGADLPARDGSTPGPGATGPTPSQLLPDGNVRINFEEMGADEDDDDEHDDSSGEDDNTLLDRNALKRQAIQAAEIAEQRARKAKKDEEQYKKRELPGDATAPKNYSRDYNAFKEFQPLRSIVKKRREIEEYMKGQPYGAKQNWNSDTLIRNGRADISPSRQLSRFQPLEKDIKRDLHSPLPILKNPIVCDPHLTKFDTPGSYTLMGLSESPQETHAVYNRSQRVLSPAAIRDPETLHTFTHPRAMSSLSQSHVRTSPRMRERTFSPTTPTPYMSSTVFTEDKTIRFDRTNKRGRAFTTGVVDRTLPVSPDTALSKAPCLARIRTRPTMTDDPMIGVPWNSTVSIDPNERRWKDRYPMEATKHMTVKDPKRFRTDSRIGLMERERIFMEEKRKAESLGQEKKERKMKRKQDEFEATVHERQLTWKKKTKPSANQKVTRTHPGTFGYSQVEKKDVWSCCMTESKDAPGCQIHVERTDGWNLDGFS
ncbi:putative axonemal dynein intermediate chain protein [Blattamonas nauphoetae]|uniref:Axonemal dynein intermediate chain protein n=1 Tax=Blattamonas nauphoetae TaxID=2049346 RepID=A0ABQ9YCM7_9EUKA|nr:putative axonemal dynein intermediate chain protein [Blattamonas nauphoetae]